MDWKFAGRCQFADESAESESIALAAGLIATVAVAVVTAAAAQAGFIAVMAHPKSSADVATTGRFRN